MSKYIKNISGDESIIRGNVLGDNAYMLVPEMERPDWASDSEIFTEISLNNIQVCKSDDGLNDIEDYSEQWSFLGDLLPKEIVLAASEKSQYQKALPVTTKRPEGSSSIKVSHDLTDKCTWHQNALPVTGETLTDSGDGLTFNSLNDRWIDLSHGRLYDEDNVSDKKTPRVYADGVEVSAGFVVDYDNGNVVFDVAPVNTVTADYHYGASSTYTLGPLAGKVMIIEHSELQFSKNITMAGSVNFEIWVYDPADLPNKVCYQKIKYKNIKDIINAANLGQGYIPAIDILTQDVLVFPFNYATVKPFSSAVGAELRITMEDDVELSGEWATATFYVLSEDI